MRGNQLLSALFALGVLSAPTLYASEEAPRYLVAPNCLTKSLTISYAKIASDSELSLIKVNKDLIPAIADAKHQTKEVCGGFMDVTEDWQSYRALHKKAKTNKAFLAAYHMEKTLAVTTKPSDYKILHTNEANQLINAMDKNRIWADLTTLTNFKNRNANTNYGVEAAAWIKTQVEDMAKSNGRNDVNVFYIPTPGYKQPSIVAKIGTSNEPGIVIGAHMDTTSWTSERQPGADDDGTGSSTVLEVTRVLLSSNLQFKKPIYVMWYAAEEQGLVGSKYVVRHFKEKNIPVSEVLHLDMTGFPDSQNPSAIWLIQDYVNADLTNFLQKLVEAYVKQPVERTACGYSCSDHASWTKGGFKAAFPVESSFERSNKAIHTSRDTMEKLSLTHMADYAKLALSFAAELGDPISSK